jgi:predicted RNA binding protein YcfA (HicA-like mRNA interferase family)
MSDWKTVKAKHLLSALLRIGWRVKRQTGSHKILERAGWADVVFAFHDNEELTKVGKGWKVTDQP